MFPQGAARFALSSEGLRTSSAHFVVCSANSGILVAVAKKNGARH